MTTTGPTLISNKNKLFFRSPLLTLTYITLFEILLRIYLHIDAMVIILCQNVITKRHLIMIEISFTVFSYNILCINPCSVAKVVQKCKPRRIRLHPKAAADGIHNNVLQ